MSEERPLIAPDLLEKLACPRTRKPLALVPADTLERMNRALAEGRARTLEGETPAGPLDGALAVTGEDFYYPIRDAIPVLLVEEAFRLEE